MSVKVTEKTLKPEQTRRRKSAHNFDHWEGKGKIVRWESRERKRPDEYRMREYKRRKSEFDGVASRKNE